MTTILIAFVFGLASAVSAGVVVGLLFAGLVLAIRAIVGAVKNA